MQSSDETGKMGQRWAKDRMQRRFRCVLVDSNDYCFPRDPSTPSIQSHTTVSLVCWRFQWIKFSARRIHVFLKVFTFGGAQLWVVSAQFKSEWYVVHALEIPGRPKKVMSCENNRRE